MTGAVQKHLKDADDSVLEVHDGVRLFQLSWNSPTQENKKEKNPRYNYRICNLWAVSATPLDY